MLSYSIYIFLPSFSFSSYFIGSLFYIILSFLYPSILYCYYFFFYLLLILLSPKLLLSLLFSYILTFLKLSAPFFLLLSI
jgi:hypothetical protein